MSAPVVTAARAPHCDANESRSFASVGQALASVLKSKPRVVGIGEAHSLRGAPNVLTATERFGNALLPVLESHGAKVLVVELISPPSGCEAETKAVAAVQKPVVQQQDDNNQERFIALGHRARELKMTPLLLEPSCDEFATVRKSGPDGVAAMLQLISDHTRDKVQRLVDRTGNDEIVVAYGGALHNNLGVDAPFAFGEQLKQFTNDRYVAIDLIVPEYVADTDAWKKFAWYPCWPELSRKGISLLQTAPNEFTLFLEPGLTRPDTKSPQSSPTSTSSADK